MNPLMKAHETCSKLPFGKYIFSKALCFKAPYFGSIKPVFQALRPGYCEVTMKNKRPVQNHLKSVHAAAMCNIAELTAGSTLETALPRTMRWIPKGMDVQYLKLAKTDLKAVCRITTHGLDKPQDLPMTVHVTDTSGVEVFSAVVNMHITAKKE